MAIVDYHDSNDGNFAFHYHKQKKIEPHFGGAQLFIIRKLADFFVSKILTNSPRYAQRKQNTEPYRNDPWRSTDIYSAVYLWSLFLGNKVRSYKAPKCIQQKSSVSFSLLIQSLVI